MVRKRAIASGQIFGSLIPTFAHHEFVRIYKFYQVLLEKVLKLLLKDCPEYLCFNC